MNFLVLLAVLDSTSAGVPNIHRRQEEVRHRYEAEEIDSDDFLARFLENFPEISDETRRKPISLNITDPVKVPIEDQYDTIIYSNPRDDEHVLFQEVPDNTIGNFASTIMTDPIPFKQETASKLEARSDIVTGFGAIAAVVSSAVAQIMAFFARKKLLIFAVIAGVLGTIGISEVYTDDLLAFAENITGQSLQRESSNLEEPTQASQESLLSQQIPGDDIKKVEGSDIIEERKDEEIDNPDISDLDTEGTSEGDTLMESGEEIVEGSEQNESNTSDVAEDKGDSSDTENDGNDVVADYSDFLGSLTRDFNPFTYPTRSPSISLTTEPGIENGGGDQSIDPVDVEVINKSDEEVSNEIVKDVNQENVISGSEGTKVEVTEISNANEINQLEDNISLVDSEAAEVDDVVVKKETGPEDEIGVAEEGEKETEEGRNGAGKVGPDFSSVISEQSDNVDLDTSTNIQNDLVNVSQEQTTMMENESEAHTSNIIPVLSAEDRNHAEESRIPDANFDDFEVLDDTEIKLNTIKDFHGKSFDQEQEETSTGDHVETTTGQYKDIFETIELELDLLPSISPELKELKPTVFVNEEVADDGN